MKKRKALIAAIIAVSMLTAVFVPALATTLKDLITAEAGVIDELNKTEILIPYYNINKNRNKELGSAENPFIVLEIVPFEAYAEIGYLIGGCEPIDFEKAKYDNVIGDLNSIIGGNGIYCEEEIQYVDFYNEDNEDIYPSLNWEQQCYGYFEKTADGAGDYKITGSVADKNLSFQYCKTGGNYTWVLKEDPLTAYENYNDVRWLTMNYTKNGVAGTKSIHVSYSLSSEQRIYAMNICYRISVYHYKNQNYFLKRCLLVPEEEIDDYHIQVITVTPETLEANQQLIAAADYINITDAAHVANMPKLWSKYYREDLFSPSEEDLTEAAAYGTWNKRTYLEHDLSWEVTVKLLCKISMDDGSIPHAPLSIAVTCYQGLLGAANPYSKTIPRVRKYSDGCSSNYSGTGTINNVAKLYMMLVVFEAEDDAEESGYFYKNYIENGLVKETTVELNGKTVTTGYFDSFIQDYGNTEEVRTAAMYWNPYTFLKVEEHDVSEVVNHGHEAGDDPAKLYDESNMIDINGGAVNSSVRNNVFTYNSDCSMTQHVVDEGFGFEEGYYHEEPFTIIEFSEQDKLAPVDIIYYLLNQKSNAIGLAINGSDKNQIWANVDYDSEVPDTAIAGEIIVKEGKLYGRVHFNVSLASNKPIANSQVAITIYRDPSYDNPATSEREDLITITEAYLEDGTLERIQLYTDCYWDVPLELLAESNTEDLKFSMKIYYRYKGVGDKEDSESYSMQKSLNEYKVDESGNVVKDERRVLTFVRRALFDLE